MRISLLTPALALMFSAACNAQTPAQPENKAAAGQAGDGTFTPSRSRPFNTSTLTSFDEPWALTFIPGGPWALVTERKGKLILLDTRDNSKYEVSGVPTVSYGGQGGFGDVVAAPDPDPTDKIHPIYLSWAEEGENDTRGAVVASANIVINSMADQIGALQDVKIIWRQSEKVTGRGHFGHRIAIAPDQKHIFISSSDRQKFDPAQDMNSNLGKIIRLNLDGSIPADNPFADKGGVTAQIWSLGQRNPLSIAFDRDGKLWESEMGPKGGDEINLITPRGNYGYPKVSNGDHYDGKPIPDHASGDGFLPPKAWWNPSISPGGMAYYDGRLFPQWRNSLLLAALSGQALIRLQIDGEAVRKADHWDMGARIREVESAPDGSVWVLEDGENAKLLKLTPKPQN
ncbi:MAG: PQQ-dependent sugar dehydrogenase [Sphingobium sp.]|nr:PQQ-dependent sugar dehydrogenase [Sphingobium sp.]